jgi:hypothetical protein
MAPVGPDVITVSLYDQANAAGNLLASGTVHSTIVAGVTNNVSIVLAGSVRSIAVLPAGGFTVGTPSTITVSIEAKDSDGNVIVGTYSNSISLGLTDSSKSLALSQSQVTASSPTPTLSYNGSASLSSASLSASASGAPSVSVALTVLAAGSSPKLTTETAQSADNIADAVGVDTHFDYSNTPYTTNYASVSSLLIASGIRHIRDGAPNEPTWYYNELNTLAAQGIRNSVGFYLTNTDAQIEGITASLPHVEAVEGPNEWDSSGEANWASEIRAFQQRLYADAKSTPALSGVTVWGPSLSSISDATALEGIGPYVDASQVHDAPCNYYPGTSGHGGATPWGQVGSIQTDYGALEAMAPNKGLVTTETGYSDTAARPCMTPDAVIAKYDPRMVLERWKAGFVRTYFYEFSDQPDDPVFGSMGLINASQNPKPQYRALQSMITLLSDPVSFAPSSLSYSIVGASSDLHHLLLEKHDGTYYLLLWRETSSYDTTAQQQLTVPGVPLKIVLANAMSATEYDYAANGTLSSHAATTSPSQSITTTVSDSVVFLQLHNGT